MPNMGIAIVRQYERGVVFRLGRLRGIRRPGIHFMIPFSDRMWKVSLRTVTMPVPSQQVITQDNVSIGVAAVAYFRRVDAVKAIVEIENVAQAVGQIAQTTVRNIVGRSLLDQVLTDTQTLNLAIREILDNITQQWGVQVFLVPALEADNDFDGILDRVDGLLVSGSRTNVHPSLYGKPATDAEGPYDTARDATSLPLIERALERGIPLLAICRGIQELNVVLGGTLANEIQEQPGMWDHRKPDTPVLDVAYGIRQKVLVKEGSCLASVIGAGEVQVNSLHRQAISEMAPRLAVEAVADDGTIEAVSVIGAKAFAVGVQWHPEYWVGSDQPSNNLFAAFGQAVRDYAAARHGLIHRTAAE